MWGTPLHVETLTVAVRSYGAPDADGVATVTTTPLTLSGCNVQQRSSAAGRDGGADSTVTTWRVSCPLAESVGPGDVVTWRGAAYVVDGEPAHFRTSDRSLDHTEFTIVRTRG